VLAIPLPATSVGDGVHDCALEEKVAPTGHEEHAAPPYEYEPAAHAVAHSVATVVPKVEGVVEFEK